MCLCSNTQINEHTQKHVGWHTNKYAHLYIGVCTCAHTYACRYIEIYTLTCVFTNLLNVKRNIWDEISCQVVNNGELWWSSCVLPLHSLLPGSLTVFSVCVVWLVPVLLDQSVKMVSSLLLSSKFLCIFNIILCHYVPKLNHSPLKGEKS